MGRYKKGRRKEYKIVKDLKKSGKWDIIQRTAGSHSVIDIIAVDKDNRVIKFIQSKRHLNNQMDYIDPKLKNKIEKENKEYEGNYKAVFEAR